MVFYDKLDCIIYIVFSITKLVVLGDSYEFLTLRDLSYMLCVDPHGSRTRNTSICLSDPSLVQKTENCWLTIPKTRVVLLTGFTTVMLENWLRDDHILVSTC